MQFFQALSGLSISIFVSSGIWKGIILVFDNLRRVIDKEGISNSSLNELNNINSNKNSRDELYDEAVALVVRERRASTSFIQRHLKIGYNRAATIIEKMEDNNVVSKPGRAGKREILIEDT